MWRISPPLSEDASLPEQVLQVWQEELRRVMARDGCIAGGAHAWLDSNMTMLRLTTPAKCCRQCGVVREDATGNLVVLPNMLGHFGPPTVPGYRGMPSAGPGGKDV